MKPVISKADYLDATESYQGWCITCQEFTRDSTEPDATEYDCPACGEHKVVGAEMALVMNLFDIEEDDEEEDFG